MATYMDKTAPPTSFLRKLSDTAPVDAESSQIIADDRVPAIFHYHGNGEQVYVVLSSDNFRTRIPMTRSAHEFTAIAELTPGVHRFKFIVDGQSKVDPAQPCEICPDGTMINVVDARVPDPIITEQVRGSPREYSMVPPSDALYLTAREPSVLPPHLHRALLNSPPLTVDSMTLPLPHHVVINHLYSAARTDGVMLLGLTHRYREKFVTTVLYTQQVNRAALLSQTGAAAAGAGATDARAHAATPTSHHQMHHGHAHSHAHAQPTLPHPAQPQAQPPQQPPVALPSAAALAAKLGALAAASSALAASVKQQQQQQQLSPSQSQPHTATVAAPSLFTYTPSAAAQSSPAALRHSATTAAAATTAQPQPPSGGLSGLHPV